MSRREERDALAAELAEGVTLCEEPIVVDSDNLRRLQDGIGEISMHFSYIRERWGEDESTTQIAETLVAMSGLLHHMLGKVFLPDPQRDEEAES